MPDAALHSKGAFQVLIAIGFKDDGVYQEVDVEDRIISFSYSDEEFKADKLALVLDNFDNRFWDSDLIRPGNFIKATWGFTGLLAPPRKGVIKKALGGIELTIEAFARSVILTSETRAMTFENVTRSDVVREIARNYGYVDSTLWIEETEEVHDIINQMGITDAHFLRRLALKEGYEFFVDHDGLHWHSQQFSTHPVRTYIYYTAPDNKTGQIINYNVNKNILGRVARVRKCAIDPNTKKCVTEEGSNDKAARTTLTTVLVFNDNTDHFDTQTVVTTPSPEDTASKVKIDARAKYVKTQRRAVDMTLNLVGDPLLLAKTVVEVQGLGTRLSGKYYVRKVDHKLGENYTCTASLITDGTNGKRGKSVLSALVTKKRRKSLQRTLSDTRALLEAQLSAGALSTVPDDVGKLITDMKTLEADLKGNPDSVDLQTRVEAAGNSVLGLGTRAKNRKLTRAGRSLLASAKRGLKNSKANESKGKLNTKDGKGTKLVTHIELGNGNSDTVVRNYVSTGREPITSQEK